VLNILEERQIDQEEVLRLQQLLERPREDKHR
jgi:hypothetical protein